MNNTYLDVDKMRIEVAILQEEIYAFEPGYGKFKIPTVMTQDVVARVNSSSSNIINKRNGNLGSSSVNIDNYIQLFVPLEYTFDYGAEKIPKGTKFLVAFIGANVNDGKIIGRYDESTNNVNEIIANWVIKIIKLDDREQKIINYSDEEDAKIRGDYTAKYTSLQEILGQNYNTLDSAISALSSSVETKINNLNTTLNNKYKY